MTPLEAAFKRVADVLAVEAQLVASAPQAEAEIRHMAEAGLAAIAAEVLRASRRSM